MIKHIKFWKERKQFLRFAHKPLWKMHIILTKRYQELKSEKSKFEL